MGLINIDKPTKYPNGKPQISSPMGPAILDRRHVEQQRKRSSWTSCENGQAGIDVGAVVGSMEYIRFQLYFISKAWSSQIPLGEKILYRWLVCLCLFNLSFGTSWHGLTRFDTGGPLLFGRCICTYLYFWGALWVYNVKTQCFGEKMRPCQTVSNRVKGNIEHP